VEEAIAQEKEITFERLQKLSDTVKQDDSYFKTVLLRAKREYTGQHMKAVYMDNNRG